MKIIDSFLPVLVYLNIRSSFSEKIQKQSKGFLKPEGVVCYGNVWLPENIRRP